MIAGWKTPTSNWLEPTVTVETGSFRTGLNGSWGVFRGELRRWFGWRGLFHTVVWSAVIAWILFVSVFSSAPIFDGLGFETLVNLLAIIPPIVGIALVTAAVCGGYHNGETAWVIGKPVPRAGQLMATITGLWAGIVVTTLFVPALIAYWWLPNSEPYRFVTSQSPPIGRYLIALGGLSLVLAFFMAFAALLSVAVRRRSAVLVVSIWALIMLRIPIAYAEWFDFTPARLIRTDILPGGWAEYTEYIHGAVFDAGSAVWGTLGLTALFLAGAVLVFRRLEL